ncbi:MAG TPA: DNA-binding protein [Candidatus Goldiibacteriota bacterium]|nr:DNA-binding protein [Candidatus Goldiibacteriota bacterium]
MKYATGRLKAVHVLKFEDRDDLLAEMESFIRAKKIKTAFLVFLGALRKGSIVSGPKKPVIPPLPNWRKFDGAWEVFGTGSVFQGKGGKPQLHLHASFGSGDRVKTGCIRKKAGVFIVVEAAVFELSGIKAGKKTDPVTGINSLFFY